MDTAALLTDSFDRIRELFADLAGTDHAVAHERPGGTANSIAWLLWHTARVQDDHVAGLAGTAQAWDEWAPRFDLPFEHGDIGYGHTSDEVAAVRIDSLADLAAYHETVHQLTLEYLARADDAELDRVVDDRW